VPGLVRGGERDQQPVVDLGVEDGDADAVGGECVAVGVREPGEGNGNPRCPERNATTWELVCRIGT